MSWRKIVAAAALLATSKNAAAAVAAGVAAGVSASTFGRDPVPWVLGAAAATVVYAYRRPETRAHALANGVISVFLGGVGAPYTGSILTRYIDPVFANDWVLAGILGAGWPWLAPLALSFIKRKSEADK